MKRETNRIINYYYFYCSVETYPGWCVERTHTRCRTQYTYILGRPEWWPSPRLRCVRKTIKNLNYRGARARTIVTRSANIQP